MSERTLVSVLVSILIIMSGQVHARTLPGFKVAVASLPGQGTHYSGKLTIEIGDRSSSALEEPDVLNIRLVLLYRMEADIYGGVNKYYNPILNRNRIYRRATITNPSDEELSNISTIKANSNNLQNCSLKQKKRITILAKRQPTIRENKSIGTYVYYNTLTTPIRI